LNSTLYRLGVTHVWFAVYAVMQYLGYAITRSSRQFCLPLVYCINWKWFSNLWIYT